MLRFDRFDGPLGIPVYYEQLPEFIKSSAVALTVFVGGADDTSVGEPGLYHWFEHLPFRGTKKFPGGYSDTKGVMTEVGGTLNAWTNMYQTTYWANCPTRFLKKACEIVTDLVANPLLSEESVKAERNIIHQEIGDKLGSIEGKLNYLYPQILWPGHPTSNHVLGTVESLNSMSASTILEARARGTIGLEWHSLSLPL